MYKTFKSILTRPVGDPLLDKFQRDVVDALKGFVLTSYSKNDVGLVPAPGTDNGSQILFDYGWDTFSFAGALHTHAEADVVGLVADLASKVPTTRNLSVTAPITGGGDLSANRTFGFDTTANLDNNARVSVSRNSGATLGTRRRINFIEGTNITIVPSDDAGNEEVDVTISAASSVAATTLTVTVPTPTTEYSFTITDAAIGATSKLIISDGMYAETDANYPGEVYMYILSVSAGSASARLVSTSANFFVGDFKFNYIVG